jgi:hypothetical protein
LLIDLRCGRTGAIIMYKSMVVTAAVSISLHLREGRLLPNGPRLAAALKKGVIQYPRAASFKRLGHTSKMAC